MPDSPITPKHRTLLFRTLLWAGWGAIVWWQMASWSLGGPPLLSSFADSWLHRFLSIAMDPGTKETLWLGGFWYGAAAVGLFAGIMALIRLRHSQVTGWLCLAAIGFATLGEISNWRGETGKMLWYWAGGAALGLPAAFWGRKNPLALEAGKASKVFPFAFLGLLILPLSSLALDQHPELFWAWNYEPAGTTLWWLRHPQDIHFTWAWTEGTIMDSSRTPFHMLPLFEWIRLAGPGWASFQAWFLGLWLISLPLFFWGLEALGGRTLAVAGTLGFGLCYWNIATARMLTTVSTALTCMTVFWAAGTWCLRGKSFWRWIVAGLVLGTGFSWYAPCRILAPVFLGWMAWEALAARRWRLLGGAFLTILTAALFFLPNIWLWREFQENVSQSIAEHIFRTSTDPLYMQRWLGPEALPPYGPWMRLQAFFINGQNSLHQTWEFLTGFREGNRALDAPGLVFLGAVMVLGAWGTRWQRWGLAWLAGAFLGPLIAVDLYPERLLFFQPLAPVLQALPFALAFACLRKAPRWERLLAGAGLAVLLAGVSLMSLQRATYFLSYRNGVMAKVAETIVENPSQPTFLLWDSHLSDEQQLYLRTFAGNGPYQWLSPDAAGAFAEEARIWGLPGNLVMARDHWERAEQKGFLPLFPEAAARTIEGAWKVLPLEVLSRSAPLPWDLLKVDASEWVFCRGCRKPNLETYTSRVALGGTHGEPVLQEREGGSLSVGYDFTLPFPGGAVSPDGSYLVAAFCGYHTAGPPGYEFPPIAIRVDCRLADSWQAGGGLEWGRPSPVWSLEELSAGHHQLRLDLSQEPSERLTLWNVFLFALPR